MYGASGAAPREPREAVRARALPDVLPSAGAVAVVARHASAPPAAASVPPAEGGDGVDGAQHDAEAPHLRRPLRRKDSVARMTFTGLAYVVTVSGFFKLLIFLQTFKDANTKSNIGSKKLY